MRIQSDVQQCSTHPWRMAIQSTWRTLARLRTRGLRTYQGYGCLCLRQQRVHCEFTPSIEFRNTTDRLIHCSPSDFYFEASLSCPAIRQGYYADYFAWTCTREVDGDHWLVVGSYTAMQVFSPWGSSPDCSGWIGTSEDVKLHLRNRCEFCIPKLRIALSLGRILIEMRISMELCNIRSMQLVNSKIRRDVTTAVERHQLLCMNQGLF